jgi:hypothetical protein
MLAIYLFLLGIFYLSIAIMGYIFVPYNIYMINIASILIIIWLTVGIIKNINGRTKLNTLFSLILPLIAIFFLVGKGFAFDLSEINMTIFIIHGLITYLCSIIIFSQYNKHRKIIKIGLGTIFILPLIPISFISFFIILFDSFVANKVVKSEISPNAIYLAEIIDSDQGALGGSTIVRIFQQNKDISILIAKLKLPPKYIYSGKWGEFNGMTLRWETDERLYINGKKYDIKW